MEEQVSAVSHLATRFTREFLHDSRAVERLHLLVRFRTGCGGWCNKEAAEYVCRIMFRSKWKPQEIIAASTSDLLCAIEAEDSESSVYRLPFNEFCRYVDGVNLIRSVSSDLRDATLSAKLATYAEDCITTSWLSPEWVIRSRQLIVAITDYQNERFAEEEERNWSYSEVVARTEPLRIAAESLERDLQASFEKHRIDAECSTADQTVPLNEKIRLLELANSVPSTDAALLSGKLKPADMQFPQLAEQRVRSAGLHRAPYSAAPKENDAHELPNIQVSPDSLVAILDGKPYKITDKQKKLLQSLIDARGEWVSGWTERGISKVSAVKAAMHNKLSDTIETESGKGYRFKRKPRKK